jgi:tetratricopeptide (TPR) repeat protein
MNKKQWLLIAIALILVVFLYSLPKIVIDNDAQEAEALVDNETGEDTGQDSSFNTHSISADTSLSASIGRIKSAYELADNKKKKSIFADSLAKAFAGLRDFDNAIMFGKEALKADPSVERKESLAEIYYEAMTFSLDPENGRELGRMSRELMEGLLKEQPDRFDLMNKVAMTYVVSETPMKGIMMLRTVLEKDPDNTDAIFNLGVLSIQSGQYDKGVERFQRLTEIDPSNVKAWYYLGFCLKETGDAAEARLALEKAAELDADPEVQASINALLQEL